MRKSRIIRGRDGMDVDVRSIFAIDTSSRADVKAANRKERQCEVERKARLKPIRPRVQGRVRYVAHSARTGSDFYRLACEHDLEGIVAKWRWGTYQASGRTSWMKIKNPNDTQSEGRHELFEKRRQAEGRKLGQRPNSRWSKNQSPPLDYAALLPAVMRYVPLISQSKDWRRRPDLNRGSRFCSHSRNI
jgi:hypothetical protein